jgi:hypothetical protein
LPPTLRTRKPVDELLSEDFDTFPIWEFATDEEDVPGRGETWVRPVKTTRFPDSSGKLIGTHVTLANGTRVRAMLGNVDLRNARATQHFLTLSIESAGVWFHLSRYHDFDYGTRGPDALAAFLGLNLSEVFPIAYDLREFAKDSPASASGSVVAEPRERLSRAELIALAIP